MPWEFMPALRLGIPPMARLLAPSFRPPARFAARGAALYATTLLLCITVTGAGLGLVTLQMAHRRLQRNLQLSAQTSMALQSGMDWTFWMVDSDPNWRTSVVSGQDYDLASVGLDQVTMRLEDTDGNLADDDTDPAVLTVTSVTQIAASGGQAVCTRRLRLTAAPAPHRALAFTVFSRDAVAFTGGVAVSGPVRAQGNITDDGTTALTAGASFETVTGNTISPGLQPVTFASSAMASPAPDLAFYTNQATLLASSSGGNFDVRDAAFTSTSSSQGAANANGVYWIDAGGQEVRLENVYVKGTLVITNTRGSDINFERPCRLEQGTLGYPVLLADAATGRIEFAFASGERLDETRANRDFNGDGDSADQVSPAISGLVWTRSASVILGNSGWDFTGCIIGSNIQVTGGVQLKRDATIRSRVVPGFTDGRLHIVRGTIAEVAVEP